MASTQSQQEHKQTSQKRWVRAAMAFLRFFFSRKGLFTFGIALPAILLLTLFFLLGPWRFLFWNLPSLSGIFGAKTYLVLLQNENELRPYGGFITGYGVIRAHGFGFDMEFFGSEDVALPNPQEQAPAALEKILLRDPKYAGWVFRDSNFDLDFSQNALEAVRFLRFDPRFQNTEFSGIIALDTKVLGALLDLTGGVEFSGREVNSGNLFETLQFSAKNFDQHNREAWQERKGLLGPLAVELLQKIKTNPAKWPELATLLAHLASEKHLTFFFSDSDIQEKFRNHEYTGELPQTPFWSINIANIGGRKGERFLRKDFTSSLHIQPNGLITERFSLRLAHEGTYNLQSDRYEAFIRVIRPQGSTLLGRTGDFATTPEQHSASLGEEISFFIILDPGEEKLFSFEISLPESVSFSGKDTLQIPLIKQAGSADIPWNFTLRGENDPRFDAQGCSQMQSHENVFFCDLILTADTTLTFTKYPDVTPPLLQFARFIDAQTIEARFSEDIFPEISEEDLTIRRKDSADSDQVAVNQITAQGENLIITLAEEIPAAKTYFELNIRNLRDISGNFYEAPDGEKGNFMTTILR